MLDFEPLVLAEAAQALRVERGANLLGAFAAVERRDGAIEIAVAHQLDQHIGVVIVSGHGDVEMLNTGCDIGHDSRELRLAVGTGAVGEHPHRRLVFADAVDAPGKMIFGAEGGLQKALDDLAVGEDLLLGALALRDCRNFRDRRRRHQGFAECDCGEGRRQGPEIQ